MSKLILYKILFIANLTISVLLLTSIILFHPSGRTLFLSTAMTIIGLFGAIAMHREIRKSKKTDKSN